MYPLPGYSWHGERQLAVLSQFAEEYPSVFSIQLRNYCN